MSRCVEVIVPITAVYGAVGQKWQHVSARRPTADYPSGLPRVPDSTSPSGAEGGGVSLALRLAPSTGQRYESPLTKASHRMYHFQRPNSSQTLAQGLEEYGAAFAGLLVTRNISPQGIAFFSAHDAVHVVFGCGTSLREEAAVKVASIFGTTAGWSVLRGYSLHESAAIYRRLRFLEVIRTMAEGFVLVPRTIRACRAQRELWPWHAHEKFMSVPLGAIRARFNIQVFR